jgi:2-polyprenyl-6-hydroxyphenyl methylase/3-demethylubiquinone-9 3-methyltransferase
MLSRAGLEPVDRKGMVFDPLSRGWRLSERDLDVNYVTAAVRPH